MEPGFMIAVGVWFYSQSTDRYLYLMRNDPRHPGAWGLPGGKLQDGETLLMAMERECQEELGAFPVYLKLVPLEMFTSPDEKFHYHTFFCCVEKEFSPKLNREHLGYAWIDSMSWPRPMHPGLWNTVNLEEIREKIHTIKQQIQISQ
jgi:8-oxo-dGTP pyrophosphatase MutT (NUDIX family)